METKDIALLIGCLLPVAACIYTDAKTYILPNWLTGSVIISGFTAAVLLGRVPDALLGALLAGGYFYSPVCPAVPRRRFQTCNRHRYMVWLLRRATVVIAAVLPESYTEWSG